MVLYDLFKVSKRLFDYFCILVLLFCWCEVILVRGGYPHFYFTVHVSFRTPSPLPFTTEDVLITVFCREVMFYFLKFIPFVL